MDQLHRRIETLSRYLTQIAIREGCSPHYDRVLRQWNRLRAEAARLENIAA